MKIIYSLALFLFLLFFTLTSFYLSKTSNLGTYGSDALYYYEAILASSSCTDFYGYGWVCLGRFWSENFGIFSSFLDIGILSIVLYIISLHLVGVIYERKRKLFYLDCFFFLNGTIIWLIARGLKEALVILCLALVIRILDGPKRRYIYLIFPTIIYSFIKPYGEFQLLLVFFVMVLVSSHWKLRFAALTSAFIGLPFILNDTFFIKIEGFFMHVKSDLGSPLDLLEGVARFILGPGPLRSLEQILYSNIFEVSNKIGDVLIFLGSLAWWGILVYVLLNARRLLVFALSCRTNLFIIIFSVIYILSYAYIDAGIVDTRHRAIVYFCVGIILSRFVSEKANYSNPS